MTDSIILMIRGKDMEVSHLCHNSKCIKPDHLIEEVDVVFIPTKQILANALANAAKAEVIRSMMIGGLRLEEMV